ncbi:glucuronyl hydrolase [Paenibacillus pectinilyticus]|uniref:Glucuronyl hydrolase n=1 Tax=Paenibacillus pectinilyticus TaxID=512399 RepID=A0A1C0ZSL8_9BACL|nr:glycoside hydrolase family 88 protein [Paenibacillus pectinilyticus]OCT11079.1 glucuronyl hydrolase [Paenibacillus pectinilyticus]
MTTIWKQAIEDAIDKTRRNIPAYGGLFPEVTDGGPHFKLIPNNCWINGFWSGILWHCYEYSGDETFRTEAIRTVASFRERLDQNIKLDHHDIGFLYSLSAKAQWMIEKDEQARRLALEAADVLLKRWRPATELIQAWGLENDPINGGRIIIDCMLNLPLLYWAYEQTGNRKYYDIAVTHADKSRRFLVRGDGSSYHTFFFNQETGDAIGGGTHQGYRDGSTWTRGQAWGIYGFALSYTYTQNKAYLETAKQLAVHFIERLPEDAVAYWDFDVPVEPGTKRDSSASAIAACGILEILEHLPPDDPQRAMLQDGLIRSMQSLVENYRPTNDEVQGFLEHGSYGVLGNSSPDDCMIWGDYFYLEALIWLEQGRKGYWYE